MDLFLKQCCSAECSMTVLLIDEINRLQLRFQNFLVSMLNVRKAAQDYYLRIPDTNEEVTCPDGFLVVIAARNLGSAFAGTNAMDLALERRFYKKIDVNYLPPESEATLVQARTGLDPKLTQVLVKVTSDTRYQLSQLKAPLDTDTLLKWAEELAYLKSNGTDITNQTVLDTARDVVFNIVLERSERGGFDQAGEAILTDNISENWRDAFAC
jgi:MoxR-like ATPase